MFIGIFGFVFTQKPLADVLLEQGLFIDIFYQKLIAVGYVRIGIGLRGAMRVVTVSVAARIKRRMLLLGEKYNVTI
jgi:hypothetical protein